MAKVRHTKNELKAQREALRRFERFLPMLQLKKQQLQMEIHKITNELTEKEKKEHESRSAFNKWIHLLSDTSPVACWGTQPVSIENLIELKSINTETGNIAGVNIPVFKGIDIERTQPDLFSTPAWIDDAIEIVCNLISLRAERQILQRQRELITHELTITSQRVNLFEKVKIPECRENIRVIKIFLGDEQTASVVRGKISKKRAESSMHDTSLAA